MICLQLDLAGSCCTSWSLFKSSDDNTMAHVTKQMPSTGCFSFRVAQATCVLLLSDQSDPIKDKDEKLLHWQMQFLPVLWAMMFQVPLQEVLVCLSVSLDISGGWSLYPRVMACGWSASSLLPYNSTHWASTRLFGYHTLLNMFVFVVLLSCFSVFVKLPVCPSVKADSSCVVFIQFSYVNRKKENGFWSEVANCSYLYTCQMQPPGAVLSNTTILMSWSYVPLQLILAHKAQMTPYSDPHKHKRSEDQQEISLLIEQKSIINVLSTDHSNAHALWAHK